MRIFVLMVFGLLTACGGGGYDAAMSIKNNNGTDTLIGSFNGSLALIHGDPKNATIEVSDGQISCNGISDSGQFSTNMSKNKVRHNFKMQCADGRTGTVLMTINARPDGNFGGARANGIGVGTLSDGSKVRIVIGEMLGSLDW